MLSGFLSMGTKDYPGNVGFKDQVMVLKWVKEYISNFGGDPNQITLMGHSAGGFSVSLHMISILSRSLFHRAIIMSGAASPQTKFQESQIFLAEKQAETLGCNTSTHDEIIHCLKTVDAAKMANTLYSMFEFGRDNPILLFNAVVEKDYGQAERFLIEDPAQSFKNGDFNNISVMIGLTTGELMWSAMGEIFELLII